MSSKLDRLRAGEIVEIEPGRKGRLNLQTKSLETNDGRKIYVGDNEDYFPSSDQKLALSREKEKIKRSVNQIPGGEFLHQFANQGIAGSLINWGNKFIQNKQNYELGKQAKAEVFQEISKRSPWISGAATVASAIPDIALTRGMSAFKAAPLLTAAHAGPRIIEEPGQVAGEAAIAAGGGFLLDKATGFLGKVAQRRQASRALPGQQQAVAAQNLAGQQKVAGANLAQTQQFNALQQRVNNENAARLHQHNLTINDLKAKAQHAQTDYQTANAARDAEILRLKMADKATRDTHKAEVARWEQETKRLNDEYKTATKKYEEEVARLPEMQKQAQAEYSQNILKNTEEIEKAFPKNARILGSQINADEFINETINSSGLAGSREGAQASRILKSLFPEGERMTAKELAKRYQGIEEAIQRAPDEVKGILSQFKEHLGKKIPGVVEDSIAYAKIIPSLEKKLEKDLVKIFAEIPFEKGEESARGILLKQANVNLKQIIREIGPDNFVQKLQNGEIGAMLRERILSNDDFLLETGFSATKKLKKHPNYPYVEKTINERYNYFAHKINESINKSIAANEIKAMQAGKEASKKLGKPLKSTYGMAPPVAPPVAPAQPQPISSPIAPQNAPLNIPPPINPPIPPLMPQKPIPAAQPTAPIPQTFSPQPAPTLPAAQGAAEKTGDFLEKNLLGGKGIANNPLAKLAGLKYLLGKAALPLEAGYLGLKGLTSPTAAGNVARISFKQSGIQAIIQLAEKYPSFHDGIVDDPRDRRSLTKEIENDDEIPIEQKAMLQSKVNRGKSLTSTMP